MTEVSGGGTELRPTILCFTAPQIRETCGKVFISRDAIFVPNELKIGIEIFWNKVSLSNQSSSSFVKISKGKIEFKKHLQGSYIILRS